MLPPVLTSAIRWSQSEEHHSTDDCCRNTISLRAVNHQVSVLQGQLCHTHGPTTFLVPVHSARPSGAGRSSLCARAIGTLPVLWCDLILDHAHDVIWRGVGLAPACLCAQVHIVRTQTRVGVTLCII